MSTADGRQWWRDAVIYQVYPRSFADGDGDGIGDIAGIRAHLDHLAGLGVDAIWLSPWYPSPMADAGYDVADYRDIDPVFGTLAGAEALIGEAHAAGIRIIVDVVPNHCSAAHPWFQAALASPDAPERELFWFRPGRGPGGDRKPTDWVSQFGGDTWTRTTNPDGSPGDWYLHLFAAEQPDLNWDHPTVRAEFADILRFWFDRGVDGIRIDSAALLVKDPSLPAVTEGTASPFVDLDGVHDIYRSWRRIADGYPGDRALIGEVWLPDRVRFANYLRPDELHAAFNFDFLGCAWDADALRECVDGTIAAHAPVGAPATWVLSNHDVTRHVTRYGRADTRFSFAAKREGTPTDLELGTVRARAAVLLTLALPGAAYVYQGEELGLWEVEDIPYALRTDPMFHRSGGVDPGRDGCRVPLPWSGDAAPFGFSPDGAHHPPWLPQPADWKDRTVQAQTGDPGSMLELYRTAIGLRRRLDALGDGPLRWLPAPPGVLAFAREPGFACYVNLSPTAAPLPELATPLLASGPLDGDRLPTDTAAWLRLD
nr:glycoside hydrolase family 13 protein [Micromonospora sp. DSM 115978]